jgi:hypothetical protein
MGAPQAVAYDAQGNLYVADGTPIKGKYYVHVYSSFGALGATWIQDIPVNDPPSGLAISGSFLYVLSSGDSNVGIYTTSGAFILVFGQPGTTPTPPTNFNNPYVGIAVDPSGDVFIADTFNHQLKEFSPG